MSEIPPATTPEEVAYRKLMVERMKARHGMPALISFFLPGVGQMMKGSILKGLAIWAGIAVNLVLCWVMIGWATLPLFWIWNVVDAYREPEA